MFSFAQNDFISAHNWLKKYIQPAPVIFDPSLGISYKCEHQHPTRSFKVRGAFYKLFSLTEEEKMRGVVTGSAGNHGQAVALAGQQFNIKVTVFVPEKTPQVKTFRMLELGAEVVRVPGLFGEAEKLAIEHARETGQVFISAYNDERIITGAGTILLEWHDQQPDLEQILVPVGGGGLISGIGLAARLFYPTIRVVGVLSEASPYLYHQFYFGNMKNVIELPTLTDGLAGAVEPGSITIDLITQVCDEILKITEEEVSRGIAHLHKLGQVVEGSGAVGVAAVLAGKVDVSDRKTGAILSGGNIDPHVLEAVIRKFSQ